MATMTNVRAQGDPLPSWNDGAAKGAITEFVRRVTQEGSSDFMPAAERIATFDNDGTMWAEQPMYFQAAFAIDRIKVLAPLHPEWTDTQPFKGVLGMAIQFGGCDGTIPNCIPTAKGWNYTVRLYRPRAEILSGAWKFPEAQPVN